MLGICLKNELRIYDKYYHSMGKFVSFICFFICFTADGVNCFVYDLGQSVLISGIRIKSKGKVIGK